PQPAARIRPGALRAAVPAAAGPAAVPAPAGPAAVPAAAGPAAVPAPAGPSTGVRAPVRPPAAVPACLRSLPAAPVLRNGNCGHHHGNTGHRVRLPVLAPGPHLRHNCPHPWRRGP
ncbi:MAG: hypothetical protein FJ149_09430, partial [Euryarchaeota archaeon]|nr:hypothetical protein [Euryarchaeota archaeon]